MPLTSDKKRGLFYAGLIAATLPITACNTVEGAGEDLESAGDAIEDTAEEAGEEAGEL